MINPKELRIGNWIQWDGQYSQVDPYFFAASKPQIWHSPIPLTTDVLEKCGFVVSDKFSHVWMKEIAFHGENSPCTLQVSNGGKVLICRSGIFSIDAPCEYLHQLQNLYFALKGIELEVKF